MFNLYRTGIFPVLQRVTDTLPSVRYIIGVIYQNGAAFVIGSGRRILVASNSKTYPGYPQPHEHSESVPIATYSDFAHIVTIFVFPFFYTQVTLGGCRVVIKVNTTPGGLLRGEGSTLSKKSSTMVDTNYLK